MFKLLTLSCLLAASVQCKSIPSPAVPYYPQPYQPAYPQGYPLIYPAQLKYNVQPTYGAPLSYPTAGYRQVLVPAIPAYNPYYYGYVPNPVYPQPYPYPYAPSNDGTQTPSPAAQPGWGEYLSSNFWNYVPNFPSFGASEQTSETENSSSSAGETASTAAEANPGKGDKQTEGQNTEQKPASDGQPAEQAPFKQLAPAFQFGSFGQPQLYSQLPYIPAVYDPSKINVAKNGAVSSFLFRNQPHPQVFQHPQLLADQKYLQAPLLQSNQGTASLAYQKYLQYQQPFQQQDQSFHQQQYDQQHQHEEPSVVVDSNAKGAEFNAEGQQQQAQPKLATGPTVAVAQPQGVAFAGIGGRAGAGPVGTAIVGKNSTAIAGPSATAISLDLTPTINLTPVHKLTTAYVAKYSPELGVYKVAEIKSL